jgi:hypothetical protein
LNSKYGSFLPGLLTKTIDVNCPFEKLTVDFFAREAERDARRYLCGSILHEEARHKAGPYGLCVG